MKKQWIIAAILVLSATLGLTGNLFAQGPVGAGASKSTSSGSAKSDSGHSSRSLNPIHWIKRGSKPDSDAVDTRTQRDNKLTAVLFAQGLIGDREDVNGACSGFTLRSDCVTALHVSKNLQLNFRCLRFDLTGVPLGSDAAVCQDSASGKAVGLSNVIHELKPEADAAAETRKAQQQAQADLAQAGE